MEELGGGAQMITQAIPWSNTGGDYPSVNAYDSAYFGSLNKCQVYLRLCKRKRLNCSQLVKMKKSTPDMSLP